MLLISGHLDEAAPRLVNRLSDRCPSVDFGWDSTRASISFHRFYVERERFNDCPSCCSISFATRMAARGDKAHVRRVKYVQQVLGSQVSFDEKAVDYGASQCTSF